MNADTRVVVREICDALERLNSHCNSPDADDNIRRIRMMMHEDEKAERELHSLFVDPNG